MARKVAPERRDWFAAMIRTSAATAGEVVPPEMETYLAQRAEWPACRKCGQVYAPSEAAAGMTTCERC